MTPSRRFRVLVTDAQGRPVESGYTLTSVSALQALEEYAHIHTLPLGYRYGSPGYAYAERLHRDGFVRVTEVL